MVVEAWGAPVALTAVLRTHKHVRVADVAMVIIIPRVKSDVRFLAPGFQLQGRICRVDFRADIPVIAGADRQTNIHCAESYWKSGPMRQADHVNWVKCYKVSEVD